MSWPRDIYTGSFSPPRGVDHRSCCRGALAMRPPGLWRVPMDPHVDPWLARRRRSARPSAHEPQCTCGARWSAASTHSQAHTLCSVPARLVLSAPIRAAECTWSHESFSWRGWPGHSFPIVVSGSIGAIRAQFMYDALLTTKSSRSAACCDATSHVEVSSTAQLLVVDSRPPLSCVARSSVHCCSSRASRGQACPPRDP